MAGKSISIAFLMRLTALVALNLALLSNVPLLFVTSPVVFALLVSLNLVLIQAVLLNRPLQSFHDTFLVVFAVSSVAFTIVFLPWLHRSRYVVVVVDVSSLLVACAIAQWRASSVRQQGGRTDDRSQAVSIFFQGAVIGFAVFGLGTTLAAWVVDEAPLPYTTRWFLHTIGLVVCPIVGGLSTLYATRSRPHERGGIERTLSGAPENTVGNPPRNV
jgi:hypothetical protein